jgi:hypothetical protein
MFGFFKDAANRAKVENEVRNFFSNHTNLNLNRVGGWALAKVTDKYLTEIKNYNNATEEELLIYLMLLHDACAFDVVENEVLLGIVIKLFKYDESQMSSDGYRSVFRKKVKEKIHSWIERKVLS